jgi:hypothetical protein
MMFLDICQILWEDGLAYSKDIEMDSGECPDCDKMKEKIEQLEKRVKHCDKMEERIKQMEDGLNKIKTHARLSNNAEYAVACSDVLQGSYIEWKKG